MDKCYFDILWILIPDDTENSIKDFEIWSDGSHNKTVRIFDLEPVFIVIFVNIKDIFI